MPVGTHACPAKTMSLTKFDPFHSTLRILKTTGAMDELGEGAATKAQSLYICHQKQLKSLATFCAGVVRNQAKLKF